MPSASVFQQLDEYCDRSDRDENVQWLVHHSRLPKWGSRKIDLKTATAYELLAACGISLQEFQATQAEAAPVLTLEQKFLENAERWRTETAHLSSPLQLMGHPSFQAILGMASENFESRRSVIRLMLADLLTDRNDWYLALSYLTHENPIHRRDYGKPSKMREAWINWGRSRGLL